MNKNESNGGEYGPETEREHNFDEFVKIFKAKLRKPKFVLEVAGFVVLSIYAGFTIAMFFATKKAANAASDSAATTQRQMADFEASQGAIIVFEKFEVVIDNKRPLRLSLKYTIKNTGQTAARNVNIVEGRGGGNINSHMYGNTYIPPEQGGIGPTLPSGQTLSSAGVGQMYFTDDDRDTEHRFTMVHVTVNYYDVFGNFKWEPICKIYAPSPDGDWQDCPISKDTIRPQ